MKYTMKKLSKRVMAVLFAAVLLLMQAIAVHAEETTLQATDGVVTYGSGAASIIIEGNEGQPLAGKQFQIHRLFEAENAAGEESIDYTLNPTYRHVLQSIVGEKIGKTESMVTDYEIIDYMQTMNTSLSEGAQTEQTVEASQGEYRYFIEALAKELEREAISGQMVEVEGTKSNNTIEISGLPYGYYMVQEVTQAQGIHAAVSMPILTTVNPTSVMRIKADYPTMTAKLYEDVGAMRGDVGDFDIGQNIMYEYISTIPEINGYRTYYHAWHTEMDEALTLKEDTIQISLAGSVNGRQKVYVLNANEFQVTCNDVNHTFAVVIQDIKAIVDREYGSVADDGEYQYGQSVTVEYLATLNDKAGMDTGRPGFETDVRLEFSNNPSADKESEHGFTPWDTVVCFTYQLQGLKVNNYGAKLEGAKFRLYRDEECTREILVKKVGSRYHVMNEETVTDETRALATEIVSDEKGSFSVCGLDADTYYLKEVEAPMGYRPLTEPIQVVLKAAFAANRGQYVKGDGGEDAFLTLSATAKVKSFVDGEETEKNLVLEVDQEEASAALSIVNQVGSKLPVTGTPAVLLVSVCGVVMIGAAMVRGRRKHE